MMFLSLFENVKRMHRDMMQHFDANLSQKHSFTNELFGGNTVISQSLARYYSEKRDIGNNGNLA